MSASDAAPKADGAAAPRTAVALPDPALAPPALPASDPGFTAQDLIDRQLALEREAHEACPFAVSRCTHAAGHVRQLVFSCRTCAADAEGEPAGVCAACSVACHADHDLVELFHRRSFRCDCGTTGQTSDGSKTAKPCTLREPPYAVPNDDNRYDHNFKGEFCYCERGKTYNPHEEKEVMFQCLICEDWLHESCTALKRPSEPGNTSDDIPSLLDHDLFEHLICDQCIRQHTDALWPYLGSRGWLLCLPDEVSDKSFVRQAPGTDSTASEPVRTFHDGVQAWKVYGLPAGALASDEAPAIATDARAAPGEAVQPETATIPAPAVPNAAVGDAGLEVTSKKRALSPSQDGAGPSAEGAQPAKRAKIEDSTAASQAPTSTAAATSICRRPAQPLLHEPGRMPSGVRLDIFLTPTFREVLCRCDKCLPTWSSLPFVLNEEPTLSPAPTSTPSESGSTYSLGLAALNHLPRERMLTALGHYQDFRAKLFALLQPFAESGQTVDEETIRAFTARLLMQQRGEGPEAGA